MKFNTQNKTVWQIGSGDSSRPYDDICLQFGIATVSPGAPGPAGSDKADTYYKRTGQHDWGMELKRMNKGDLAVLRKGRHEIVAVGYVTGDYGWSELLSDIHGWDSQHYIEVDWHVPATPINIRDAQMNYSTMTQLRNDKFLQAIDNAEFTPYTGTKRSLADLKMPKEVSIEDVEQALINHGLRIQDAENIARTIARIKRLALWYKENDPEVLEHEIRTFLVIPLLISLGWSEQKIKIELSVKAEPDTKHKRNKRMDIAVFSTPYINPNQKKYNTPLEPVMIVETKSYEQGLFHARNQANQYAAKYPTCSKLLLSNGYIYNLYEKFGKTFDETGYLNLLDMRDSHYLNKNIEGAIPVILKMSGFANP